MLSYIYLSSMTSVLSDDVILLYSQKAKGKGAKQKKQHIPSNAHSTTTQSDNSEEEAVDELTSANSDQVISLYFSSTSTICNFHTSCL